MAGHGKSQSSKSGEKSTFCSIMILTLIQSSYHTSSAIKQGFPYQNNFKDLDLSYKTDLDIWNCFGRENLILLQNFIRVI